MKKIYLSGPISGTTDFKDRFLCAELDMCNLFRFPKIRNPVKFCSHLDPWKTSWAEYMDVCIPELEGCTHIYMMDGWEDSKGACVEYYLARQFGLTFI